MLDAGVPVTSLVAGVAMGLILGESEGDEPVILTDILGLEDALGTMDFKVHDDAAHTWIVPTCVCNRPTCIDCS